MRATHKKLPPTSPERRPITDRLCPLGLLLLGTLLPGQTNSDKIAVLEGSRPDDLTLRLFAEANPKAAGKISLSGLQILPIEITNRTVQMAFVPGHSRLVDQPGWPHIVLPGGGKLFRYRRTAATTHFGYLLITASGQPVVVHEAAATGLGGRGDPYEDRIGVAPDGRHASLLTKAGALFVARLDGLVFASTKTPARPLTLPAGVLAEPLALSVGKTHLFLVTDDDRIRRCALADGNQPVDLTPTGPANSILKDELAPSGNGTAVAFLYGPKKLFSIYLLRSSGAAVLLPPKPAHYEEPGYLPEFTSGPRLLLNDDASRLMYVDATLRDEIFVLDTVGKTGTTHITSDANFLPYIGIGILPAFAAQTLHVAVGNPSAFDWFAATTNSRVVTNLTRTGAVGKPPFDAGKLIPVSGFLGQDGAVVTPELLTSGAIRVRRLDPIKASSTFLVSALRAAPRMGSALSGAPTVLLPGRSGDVLLGQKSTTPALIGPPGVHLSGEAISPTGWFGVLTARDATRIGGITVPVIHLHGVGIHVMPPESGLRQIVLTRNGGAVLVGKTARYLAPGVGATLPGNPAIRVVVSGASQ